MRLLLLMLGSWLAGAVAPAAAADIALCADVWCPYNCDPASGRPGFAVDIAREVFAASGLRVTYQVVNWARCIEDARSGRYTGIIGAIRGDAPDFIFPALPIGMSSDGFAVRRGDDFQFAGEQSFDGRVLGVTRSYSFDGAVGAYLVAHGNDVSRVAFVSGNGALTKNLAKLLTGRVDVVLDDENVLRNTIADLGLEDKVVLRQETSATPVFIAFSPADSRSKALARTLDLGIARLRASRRLADILAAYHVLDGS